MLPSKVIVTMTTRYLDPEGRDRVRFALACQLCEEVKKHDHLMIIADASPKRVKDAFLDRDANVIVQEKGMGASRRQVWREAKKFVTSEVGGIYWTEEKPSLIPLLSKMLNFMQTFNAHVLIPERRPESWKSYPDFQVASEAICLKVYHRYFGKFDPMFGPVLWVPEVNYFFTECSAVKCAKWGVEDTYLQHWVPIYLRYQGYSVISFPVNWRYPLEQRQQEESEILGEMIIHRLSQLDQFLMGYIALRDYFGPMPD